MIILMEIEMRERSPWNPCDEWKVLSLKWHMKGSVKWTSKMAIILKILNICCLCFKALQRWQVLIKNCYLSSCQQWIEAGHWCVHAVSQQMRWLSWPRPKRHSNRRPTQRSTSPVAESVIEPPMLRETLSKTHGPISFLVMNQNKPFSLQKSRVHRHLHHIEMNGNWFSISKLWPTSKVHHPPVLLTSQEFQTSIHLHRGIGPQQKHRPWQQHQQRPLRNVEPTGDQQLIPWCKVEKHLKATEVYSN